MINYNVFLIISIVLVSYNSSELINVSFKRLLHVHVSYDFYSKNILHSHTVVHVLSPKIEQFCFNKHLSNWTFVYALVYTISQLNT